MTKMTENFETVFVDFLLNALTRLDSNCNAVTRNAKGAMASCL